MPLEDSIKRKQQLLDKEDDKLVRAINAVQIDLFRRIQRLLKRLAQKDGRLENDETTNTKLLLRLSREIFDVFEKTKYRDRVERFLLNFDKVEALSLEIISSANEIRIRDLDLNAVKREAINTITEGLLKRSTLQRVVVNRIRRTIYRGVLTGERFSDVESLLRREIKGNSSKLGFLASYVRNTANDALFQYDGTINEIASNEYDLNAFRFVGSLIKTSRQNCTEMINKTGTLGRLAQEKGVYLKSDLEELIRVARDRPGFNPNTTPSTYLIYRNGYGCRHLAIPFNYENETARENVLNV